MRYIYIDPTIGSVNFGDAIIDVATRALISPELGEPTLVQGGFEALPTRGFDFAILPGVTALTPGDRPLLASLAASEIPCYCLAGSYWYREPVSYGWLLRTRVVMRRPLITNVAHLKGLAHPIGVRDPFTRDALRDGGLECTYAGCPTLHLDGSGVADDGFTVVSFGRGHVRQQVRLANKLARRGPVICVCHEKHDRERYRAAGLTLPLVSCDDGVEIFLSYLKRATAVITGRLHGALPAIAFEKPLLYYGTSDSRISILNDLGVRVYSLRDVMRLPAPTTALNKIVVERFRQRYASLVSSIKSRHGNGE